MPKARVATTNLKLNETYTITWIFTHCAIQAVSKILYNTPLNVEWCLHVSQEFHALGNEVLGRCGKIELR